MENELFTNLNHIIVLLQKEIESTDYLSVFEQVIGIASGIVVIIGGVLGISYINKLKNKTLNATFGYFARLKVHLCLLNDVFKEFNNEIVDHFLPEIDRPEIDPSRQPKVYNAFDIFNDAVKRTYNFLEDTDEQMPASNGWTEKYNTLLEFLIDCEKLENVQSYIWNEKDETKKKQYIQKHLDNLKTMINDINIKQKDIENQLYGKKWWKFWIKKENSSNETELNDNQ